MSLDLFDDADCRTAIEIGPDALLLRGFASEAAPALLGALDRILVQAPLRHMVTPGGFRMSVAMSNCGALGWVSDDTGYRYAVLDPQTSRPWPALPARCAQLARDAASQAGFDDFAPDACLINRYEPGTRLSLHQDRNERDFAQPIVSVSLGISAAFLFGGPKRADRTRRIELQHGDVVVWGGRSRLHYHGVLPIKPGHHPLLGDCRLNLTFRKAG